MTENRRRTGLVVASLLAAAACTGSDAAPLRSDGDRITGEALRLALNDDRLRATHAGHTLYGRYPSGASWQLFIGADGDARIEGRNAKGNPYRDRGRWEARNGRSCFTWRELRRGQEYCLAVLPVGDDRYLAVRSNGRVDSAYMTRPGTPTGSDPPASRSGEADLP
jgi:hypothetical protein